MKIISKSYIILAILLVQFSSCTKNPSSSTKKIVSNPYLGQIPPGETPELFAPEIFQPDDWGITFSHDSSECYFSRKTDNLYSIFTTI